MGALDVALARATIRHARALKESEEDVVVLQSMWALPLGAAWKAKRRIFAAIDEFPFVDTSKACEWSDSIFCVSPYVESVLRARHPGKAVWLFPQCGRFASEFSGPRDAIATVVYVGLDHDYVLAPILRGIAGLPVRLLLVGCDSVSAARLFGGRIPPNVEPLGWLQGADFGAAVARAWVGIVPYDSSNPRVIQSNPDKVYDYLLAGLAVVSTPVDALRDVPGVVQAPADRFVNRVRDAVDRFSPSFSETQRAYGAPYSADRFAARFIDMILGVPGA